MNQSNLKKAPQRAESAGTGCAPTKRKRILLAESDGFIRLVLMFRFRMSGFEVDFTSNSRVALRKLRSRRPDVIVADITLNGLSGLELMRTARSDSEFGGRPIYAFTHAEPMSWATRKELRSLDAQVFDKGSSNRDLVETLVQTVLDHEGAGNAMIDPGAEEITLPPEIEEIIARVRRLTKAVARRRGIRTSAESFSELRTWVCALASCSEAIGLRNLVRQSKALESLLAQLCKEKKNHTRAAIGTVVRAAQVMKELSRSPAGTSPSLTPFTAVLVDKEPASNRAALQVLTEAGFHPVAFEDTTGAREYLSSNPANLIILNLLPGDSRGLTATELKRLPLHAATPIIDVPESLIFNPSRKKAPGILLLNENPLLLKELVMKSLNAVQSKRPPADGTVPLQTNPASQDSPHGSKTGDHPAESVSGQGKKTVLFVEDDPFVLKVYKKCLVGEGFKVEVAEDGLLAVKMLPKVRPDVVVLDLMLPKLDGLEVLRFIRAEVTLKHIPVLVLSNGYLEGLAAKAKAAGATRGILKTHCTPTKLVEDVCELVGRPCPQRPPQPVLREPKMVPPRDEVILASETAPWVLMQAMMNDAPKEIMKIRQACLEYIKPISAEERAQRLAELYHAVRCFGTRAGLSGFSKLAELCSALEGLLFQIIFNEAQVTASTMQTIAQAVDSIDRLSQKRDIGLMQTLPKCRVLVVDDDEICNFTIVSALKRSGFDAVGIQNPVQALETLKGSKFDLILLDIDMPQLSGFQVCEQLRQLPQYKSVPVIFITLETDFKNRACSSLARGNDVVAKPVSPLEIILRVTMHLINSGEQNESRLAAAAKAADAVQQQDTAQERSSRSVNMPDTQFIIAREARPSKALGPGHGIQIEPLPRASATAIEQPQLGESQPDEIPDIFKKGPSASQPEQTAMAEAGIKTAFPAASHRAPAAPVKQPQLGESQLDEIPDIWKKGPSASQPAQTTIAEAGPEAVFPAALQRAPAAPVKQPQFGESQLDEMPDIFKKGPSASQQGQAAIAEAAPKDLVPGAESTQCNEPGIESPFPAPPGRSASQADALERYEKEREGLVNRLCIAEMELHRTNAGIERRDQQIKELTQQLTGRAAHTAQPAAARPQLERGPADTEVRRRAELESAQMRHAQEELNSQLAGERQVVAAAKRHANELEGRLQQKSADLERARTESEQQKWQLEQELAGQRQARETVEGQLAKATAESSGRIKQLETDLGTSSTELKRTQAELGKQSKEQGQAVSELRRQLEQSAAIGKATEAAQKQAQARCGQLEQELTGQRQARETVEGQLAKVTAESSGRIKQLETDLGVSSTELKRTQAELEKQSKEQGQAVSELRRQLEQAAATGKATEAAQKQAQARCGQLEQELAGQRQARETVEGQLAKATAESSGRIKQLETDLGTSSTELKRTQAELEKQSKEQGQAISELRGQLEQAAATGKATEAAQKQAQARCGQLEQELAGQRQARETLEGQLAKVTAESSGRIKQLETDLGTSSTELKRTQAELEKQSKEQGQAVSELRRQLEQAAATGKATEAAQKQAQARCGQLEQELAGQRQARETVEGQLAKATAESSGRIKQLETDLGTSSTELKRTQAELEKQSKEQGQAVSELRRQLEQSAATGKATEAAQKQAQARCGQLEQELAGQRQARETLEGQLAKVTAESSGRIKQLETDLGTSSTELKRTQAELEKQSKEQGQAVSELRRQLEQAAATGKATEAAQKQAQARCGQLEQELAGQRQARETVEGQLAKATAESSGRIKQLETDLGTSSTELKRTQAELEKQSKEQGQAVSELRRQLEQAAATGKATEAAQKQAQARCGQLEQELAGQRQARETLEGQLAKVTAESSGRIKQLETDLGTSSTELKRTQAELEKQSKEQGQAVSELRRQLEQAAATGKATEAAQKQAQARCGQLEQELAGLRRGSDTLSAQLAKEQQAAATSLSRIKQLESALGTSSTELKSARAELEKRTNEHGVAEKELRRQLETANATLKQSEANGKQAQARHGQLEQELEGLRKAHEELTGKFAKEQQLASDSGARIKQLESSLASTATELARAKAQAEKRTSEHGVAEKDLRRQLEAANASLKQSETAGKQAQSRHGQLEQELAVLRQAHEELTGRLASEEQNNSASRIQIEDLEKRLQSSEAGRQAQITELDQRVRHGAAALAQASAELANERGQRQRTEQRALESQHLHLESRADLETKLHQAQQALAQRQAEIEQERAEHQLAEEQSQTGRELNAQLQKNVASFEEARQTFDSSRQDLESRLSASLSAMHENESRLQREVAEHQRLAHAMERSQHELQRQTQQRETLDQQLQSALESLKACEAKWHEAAADRQRLNEALEAAQLNLRDRSRRGELEASQLKSSLHLEQVERRKQESEIARLRQSSLEAARSALVLHAGLRRQIREPVHNLSASARRLLALEMGERQKKLAEAVLHDALLLQARLQQAEGPRGDSHAGAQESEQAGANGSLGG